VNDPNSWMGLIYAVLGAAVLWLLQRFNVAPAPVNPTPTPDPAPTPAPAPLSGPPLKTGNPFVDLMLPMLVDAVMRALKDRFGAEVHKAVSGVAGRILPTEEEWASPTPPKG
jgi:hypothetical protein